jgi:hypothetical protein
MKKTISALLVVIAILSFCGCSGQELANMGTKANGDYQAIIWDGRTYVPYCAISKKDCGKQIGIINGDSKDKVYEYNGCSTDEWIANMYVSGLMDAPMLFREIDVTVIPNGLKSEYSWNN